MSFAGKSALPMIVIGTFIRGPGWMWFWPTQTWDHNRIDFAVNRNLDQIFGFDGAWLVHVLPASWRASAPRPRRRMRRSRWPRSGSRGPRSNPAVVPQFEIWYVEYFAVSFACSEAIGAFFDGWRSMQLRCCHALASRRAIQDSRCLSLHRLPTPNRRAVRCRRLLPR